MKLRPLLLAVAVLAVLSGVVALVNRPPAPPAADARIGQPLVATDLVDKAAGFRLTSDGKTVELKKTDGVWRVVSYHDFAADVDKLTNFVREYTEAKLARLVTSNAAGLARLEFKDTRVQLLDAAGQPLLELVLGKMADTGGGRFVRLGVEDKAYLANLRSSFLDVEAKNWADASIFKLNPDEVAKIELNFPSALAVGGTATPTSAMDSVVATHAKKEEPYVAEHAPVGQRLKPNAFTVLLSNLADLRFSDTAATDAPEAVAAKASARTLKLTTFDGKTITLGFGRKPEEKKPKVANAKPADATATPPAPDKPAADAAKPVEPEFDITPAGPVFVTIAHSDPAAPVNALMTKRAFQIPDYIFAALPQKIEETFEPITPEPASATAPASAKIPETPAPAK